MTFLSATDNLRLQLLQAVSGAGFSTELRRAGGWQPVSPTLSRPLDTLPPAAILPDGLAGSAPGLRWRTTITPQAGGFWLETVLEAEREVTFSPAMILWLGALDNLDDRQAHTWRQTILRAPTTNQQGLGGNDLPAAYVYDHATRTETICYFPPDAFAWAPHRFYDFSIREVLVYRPEGRYGLGLVPNTPTVDFTFPAGTHRFCWWFMQSPRPTVPTPWEAQRALVEAVAPLLDDQPRPMPDALPWHDMAVRALHDLNHDACWVTAGGVDGLRAYVRGSSAVGRDAAPGFELMTQLDVLWPLLLWRQATGAPDTGRIAERLHRTLAGFARPELDFVANNFPPKPGDSFMDTWYFLENALIKLPWVAYLTGDDSLKTMFFSALRGAAQLARHTGYLFPLFADAAGWQPRGSLLNVSVGGLYAAGCVLAHQFDRDPAYLAEAARALRVLHTLPPHQLTHEPQQLSFGAAAAAYLARAGYEPQTDWRAIAADLVYLSLRMGYWAADPAVPFYDPRGMFQACASLCYPAFKENVETLLVWAELLAAGIGPARLMAAFANLQRRHNYAFFDPFLPPELRRGPCACVPYEDLATAEFTHTAKLGKELYGAGEVFWSALLFDALGSVDAPDVLCLSLDVPALNLKPVPVDRRRYLLYNPADAAQTVTLHSPAGSQSVALMPRQTLVVTVEKG
ncbi:MAG: hypothetical protein HZC41_00930 [Chloroflexi bacterium]|nr:hypothetical protein [Chloroflexota bacterium]